MRCRECGALGGCGCSQPRGVGSLIAEGIPWYVPKPSGCNCSSWASWLDSLSPEECEAKFDFIVNHLVSQSSKTIMSVAPEGMRRSAAEKIVRKAIDKAKDLL